MGWFCIILWRLYVPCSAGDSTWPNSFELVLELHYHLMLCSWIMLRSWIYVRASYFVFAFVGKFVPYPSGEYGEHIITVCVYIVVILCVLFVYVFCVLLKISLQNTVGRILRILGLWFDLTPFQNHVIWFDLTIFQMFWFDLIEFGGEIEFSTYQFSVRFEVWLMRFLVCQTERGTGSLVFSVSQC